MSDKTELQRDILVTAYRNPNATQKQIADVCNCSASYVSNVLGKHDQWDAMDAEIEQMNQQLGYDLDRGLSQAPAQEPAWSDGGFEQAEPADAEDIAEFIDRTIEAAQTLSGDQHTSMSMGEAIVTLTMSIFVIAILAIVSIYIFIIFI